MSTEFLEEVLEKIAKVTVIIVETSKIKEDLDSKNCDDKNVKDIFHRTKIQVDNLFEHAKTVKDFFDKQEEEVSQKLNGVNGEKKNSSEGSDTDAVNSRLVESQSKKPLIKVVDINKLVEPRPPVKKDTFKVPPIQVNNEEIVILSSDEEPPQKTKVTRTKLTSKRKAAQETIRKTRLALQNTSSDSESSEGEVLSKLNKKSNKQRNGSKRKTDNLNNVTISDTSSLSSNSSNESRNASGVKNTDKQKEDVNVETDKQRNKESELEPEWKKDLKFSSECYVKVYRVPCEKLKEYYFEKLDLLEINRLCDVDSLKRKRRRKSASESNPESENSTKSKRKPESKSNDEKHESDSSGDDVDMVEEDPLQIESTEPGLENTLTDDISNRNDDIEQAAEDAVNLLNSDRENETDDSPNEEPPSSPPKENTGKEEETTTEKEASNQQEECPSKEQHSDYGENGKEISTVATEAQSKDEACKETEPEKEKKEGKEKSDEDNAKTRKDKLLASSASGSDSDDHQNTTKKKEKKQDDDASDDEPKTSMDKKKRLTKKRKKKAILSDSDSDNKKDNDYNSQSESSSESEKESEEKEESENRPKSRKRVKRVQDSSDEDGEDKSTRKQIRNIWGRDSLAETTKKAEAEEKERKARIADKQKKYNQIYESNSQQNAKVDKVVLDFDEKNNKELLRVDDRLVAKLKPHQASGVQFMWDACFESLERSKNTKGSGCILAHCMGLGKTLQVITLSHTLLVNSEETNVRKVLVVSPLNTVLNWVSEFKMWLPDEDDFEIFELVSFKQNHERQYQVKTWHTHGGVLIIGYDMFRNLSNPENKRLSKKMRQIFQEALVDPGPDLVVCDEGHLLKNEKANISIAMNRIRTLRRIVLTGTPLQNNLKEYFCMVQFIKPNLLGTYREYLNRFVNPITNGQYTDSTLHDIQVMRKRSHVLHKMLDGVVQRRDYAVLKPYLPPKHEYVVFLSLTEIQVKLYEHYMNHFARGSAEQKNRTSYLFVDFQALQRVCTHPRVLLDKSIEMKQAKDKRDDSEEESEGSLRDFINDDDEEESTSSSSNSGTDEEGTKANSAPRKRVTRATAALAQENGEDDPILIEDAAEKEWWQEYCDGEELDNIAHSSKLFLLFEILKECEQIGDKVLVFSQSLYSLNVIEHFLAKIHDATQAGETHGGYSGSWCVGLDYFRLDGSSSCDNRSIWCKTFNDPSNTRARLFLISTKAGGLGINLVAANRVIIFDVSWNPSHDIQSIYRVYRFGQTKPCYVYRFVTLGTMEMKVYERQVTKQAISKRVIDEQQIDRHYNQNDLAELYRFDPKPGERPLPMPPKDVLLAELIQKFEDRIYKYHEHQTLLENKQDEELNEEERKAAWEEFENEKKQRNYLGSNFVRPNNIELALASIVQKDNPTWNDVQIRAMIPVLHMQLQQQVARGDLTMYKRVQQEIHILQAIQKRKELLYQQQAMRLLQQQQQFADGGWLGHYVNQNQIPQMPGTSRIQAPLSNPNDIIDLND